MDYEIEQAFGELIRLYEGNELHGHTQFLSEDELEDNYSHNDIDDIWRQFELVAQEYLEGVAPGKYKITYGWCVFISEI
ncbi:MAG: hypothetical protein K0S76_452 [Herbinix sp.]|jgi:hypothetical protein|nr:hypothetical protein [Herbinix sp.]